MGVRIISEAARFTQAIPTWIGHLSGIRPAAYGGQLQGRRTSMPRFTILADGTGGKEGLPAALPANEAWMDPTIMLHAGEVEVGISAVYSGAGSCKVYGCMLPSDYAQRVAGADGAALVAEAAGKWEDIVTLLPNAGQQLLETKIPYTLYRLEFLAANVPGSVIITAM